jgi:hypothetical protein
MLDELIELLTLYAILGSISHHALFLKGTTTEKLG